jgi:hypothetical protein
MRESAADRAAATPCDGTGGDDVEKRPDELDIVACCRMEWEILELLLFASDDWPWWPIEEVMRRTAEPITALDAMAALCDGGLLQRKGEFIMITRAALRFYQLITWP